MSRAWLPPSLLALFALSFAWLALGGGLLVVDDHPGQLYRLERAIELGPWPWRFDPGWWAGYAELQFYPPGLAYLGVAVHALTAGALSAETIYQSLLWAIYLLPGATTYWLLARVLGRPWLALPGAFLALTLSAGSRSGVEEGLRWGLVASRLGWALLPALALSLRAWPTLTRPPIGATVLLAAIVLVHPAHAPAALVLAALRAADLHGEVRARAGAVALLIALGIGLAGFWLVPLLAHLDMARPLAWGDGSLGALAMQIATRPLLLGLSAAAAHAWWTTPATSPWRWLARFAPVTAIVVALDSLSGSLFGLLWLPADRLMDSLLLALIVGASLSLGAIATRLHRLPEWGIGLGAIAVCAILSTPLRSEPTLTLWPRRGPAEWTRESTLVAGDRLGALWTALRAAPEGRILFVRSSVPLAYGLEWWRPHSHITALAPIRAGREIVNGTFTHPSPIAGFFYTGSAARAPITQLVEQRDGITLFGKPLDALTVAEFDRLADRLRISAVVAPDEDEGRLPFVEDNPAFPRRSRIGPFTIFIARDPRVLPRRVSSQRWTVEARGGAWEPTGFAYSPLWRASATGRDVGVRRDDLGMLEVRAPTASTVELRHPPGVTEWLGIATSIVAVLGLAAWRFLGRRRRTAE